MKSVRWAAAAEVELVEAAAWYEARQGGLGAELIVEVDVKVEILRSAPQQFPVWEHHRAFNRALIERFPYALLFRFTDDLVFIFALAHTSRQPGYWLNRAGLHKLI